MDFEIPGKFGTALSTLSNSGSFATEFDLHGIVGIRLEGASPADAAAVARQLGPIDAPLARDPDIVVRFVEHLPLRGRVRLLGVDEAAFTDDAFLVLRSKQKARTRVQIPFGEIGRRCEILCEHGLPAVPLLIAIVNLTALARGALPLHAAAFSYQGVGVLTTGWSKGGKTESLLGFIADGAQYVADEWVYLTGDGEHMYGIPEPIRVWDWHLNELPHYRPFVARKDRIRLRTLRAALRALEHLGASRRKGSTATLARRAMPLVRKQMHVDIAPERVFSESSRARSATPQKVFFVMSHDNPSIEVHPIEASEVARRMVFSLEEERSSFLSYYLMCRFAFPEVRNELLERTEQMQREALSRIVQGKDCYVAYHPYPFRIRNLVAAMRPHVLSPVKEATCVSST